MKRPLIIGICGQPKSGKSEIQTVLRDFYNITPFDDGNILRRHAAELFDIPLTDLETQQGKLKTSIIQGRKWQNRKILGEYGKALESLFGPYTVPNWGLRMGLERCRSAGAAGVSFGSVRRDQGRVYRDAGGLVLEVKRPGVDVSENVWDAYELAHVSHTYNNNTDSLDQLTDDFRQFFDPIYEEFFQGDTQDENLGSYRIAS